MRKYHKEVSENTYKVDEQIQGMHDEVPATNVILLDDQLRIVNNEAANNEQSHIQVRLIEEGRA